MKSELVRPHPFQSPPHTFRILSMSTGWLLFAFYEIDLTVRTPWAPCFSIRVVQGWYRSLHLFSHASCLQQAVRQCPATRDVQTTPHNPVPPLLHLHLCDSPQEHLGVCCSDQSCQWRLGLPGCFSVSSNLCITFPILASTCYFRKKGGRSSGCAYRLGGGCTHQSVLPMPEAVCWDGAPPLLPSLHDPSGCRQSASAGRVAEP